MISAFFNLFAWGIDIQNINKNRGTNHYGKKTSEMGNETLIDRRIVLYILLSLLSNSILLQANEVTIIEYFVMKKNQLEAFSVKTLNVSVNISTRKSERMMN